MHRYIQCGNNECRKIVEAPQTSCECGYVFDYKHGDAPLCTSFPSGYWRDITLEPTYIKGKADLRAITRDKGQVSLYAED